MKKTMVLLWIFLIAGVFGTAWAISPGGYRYITAKDLKDRIDAESPMIIIDVCPAQLFAKRHIRGSIETNAYPVKTESEKAKLVQLLAKIKSSTDDIIIVCPMGGGGARNTVDYFKMQGIDAKKLLILEKGIFNWPYETDKK
jgi:rhodanese-related sulfurtransferase